MSEPENLQTQKPFCWEIIFSLALIIACDRASSDL